MRSEFCFPLHQCASREEILFETLQWLIDLPFTKVTEIILESLRGQGCFVYSEDLESIEVFQSKNRENNFIKYRNNAIHTFTAIDVHILTMPKSLWVSVSITRAATDIWNEHLETLKPTLLFNLISKFGGGFDGKLTVTVYPVILEDSCAGKQTAAEIIKTNINCKLPVIYVSASNKNQYSVIPDRLARKVCGIAHVVVEPNREFSMQLRHKVASRNAYGGVVAIYWPQKLKSTLFQRESRDTKLFEQAIFEEIYSTLFISSPRETELDESSNINSTQPKPSFSKVIRDD
ncbi:hypothetical protein ACIP66_03185 [Pseudomonas sp. NPDC088429]|uniref:hypothetical protein n=1 Tax=Pseudomonas sp. NPDC088429 TaxID=3364455 RepID=UPI003826886D